jgi:hypothetical protein
MLSTQAANTNQIHELEKHQPSVTTKLQKVCQQRTNVLHNKLHGKCHGMVPILLGVLLDLGKGPLSIAMAMGISIVMLVTLATILSTSFICCLALYHKGMKTML